MQDDPAATILLQYINPDADHLDIRVAAVAKETLRHGAIYEVELSAGNTLLRRPEWRDVRNGIATVDGVVSAVDDLSSTPTPTPDDTIAGWADVSGIGPELAQALARGLGITDRQQLQSEIAAHGIDRIIQIPGIGDARAARLVEYAKD